MFTNTPNAMVLAKRWNCNPLLQIVNYWHPTCNLTGNSNIKPKISKERRRCHTTLYSSTLIINDKGKTRAIW